MKNTLLQGENLCKTFAQGDSPLTVLDHIDVDIFEGDFTVIMGASGAGKSTLLYALSGMDSITSGQVRYKSKVISGLSEKEMARLRAREFGFVFQQTNLVSNLTLLENVAVAGYVGKIMTPKEADERAVELLEQMKVGSAKNRLPAQVSGGEAQRAALARGVINSPGLLFADEPTGALNRSGSDEVLGLLTELNTRGQSILMVTHDIRSALRGNRILYLEDGRVLDDLELPPYDPAGLQNREARLTAWLSGLRW